MKKYFKLLFMALCAVAFAATPASAEEFFASDFTGAAIEDKIVTVNENEAELVYEWYTEDSGSYNVSFNDAVCSDCNIVVSINDGYDIKIADITKPLVLGFNAGINKISFKIKKNSDTAVFSAGTITLTYIGALDTSSVHIEANESSYTYITSGYKYYDNYGSDMSDNDVILMQKSSVPEIVFTVYAPISGEYSMTGVMSHLGQTYTSDINMSVNGRAYPLTKDTMTHLANLTNAADSGLMKRFRKNSTVTLKKGMNTVVFSAIEKRDKGDIYIFFLDCVDFTFANEVIEIETNVNTTGTYNYSVLPAYNAEYAVEITMISKETEHRLPELSISADGVSYIQLVKGETVKVVSEYFEDGYLYGTYRLLNNIAIKNKIYLKIGSDNVNVNKISLIPVIAGLNKISARTYKAILLPGESTEVSAFATDENGYALNLNFLRKNGGVTFKSSDRDILAVDAAGKVTALNPGIAHITAAASDGTNSSMCDVGLNVYNESYGFTVLSAEKDEDYVKVRLLSPFGAKEGEHTMVIAEFADNTLINVTAHTVEALSKGQIVTYKAPATENDFKIISVNTLTSLKPVYEVITVEEVQ